jgi:cytochrome c-type biogenesis protein
MRVGGILLVVVGLLLVSGLWQELMVEVRGWVSGYTTAV